jgi:hypothetical protein
VDAGRRRPRRALDVRVAADAGAVRCSPRDLERILDVLVENALHYGPAGQQLVLAASPGRVEVLDEGPARRPARRTRSSGASTAGRPAGAGPRGTGLGLAIARELAGRAGGGVTLRARTGGGGRGDRGTARRARPGARMRSRLLWGLAALAGNPDRRGHHRGGQPALLPGDRLSSQPLSAGGELAPAAASPAPRRRARRSATVRPRPRRTATPRSEPPSTPAPTATVTAVPTAPPPVPTLEPDDDNSQAGAAAAAVAVAGAAGTTTTEGARRGGGGAGTTNGGSTP